MIMLDLTVSEPPMLGSSSTRKRLSSTTSTLRTSIRPRLCPRQFFMPSLKGMKRLLLLPPPLPPPLGASLPFEELSTCCTRMLSARMLPLLLGIVGVLPGMPAAGPTPAPSGCEELAARLARPGALAPPSSGAVPAGAGSAARGPAGQRASRGGALPPAPGSDCGCALPAAAAWSPFLLAHRCPLLPACSAAWLPSGCDDDAESSGFDEVVGELGCSFARAGT
mmetsp:Transcript_38956/g.86654  ORF Transcript_38956/g.86654 Transcript_38956/m.86654 type:complete len:223 (-) Transcript_38956:3104-3772(-)